MWVKPTMRFSATELEVWCDHPRILHRKLRKDVQYFQVFSIPVAYFLIAIRLSRLSLSLAIIVLDFRVIQAFWQRTAEDLTWSEITV